MWVLDDATSPCVDTGDPAADFASERRPNGGRLNVGAYGGTAFASMSEPPFSADVNDDGVVDYHPGKGDNPHADHYDPKR